jgi:hypothetical protein
MNKSIFVAMILGVIIGTLIASTVVAGYAQPSPPSAEQQRLIEESKSSLPSGEQERLTAELVNGGSFLMPIEDIRKVLVPSVGAPIATSGENVYIAWWTNETGNDEVMFRSSNNGGSTFGDKMNLSNTTDTDSQDVEIDAEGDNVAVTWWERNSTQNEPMVRMSTDNGQTFGSLLNLGANGTISSGEQTQ